MESCIFEQRIIKYVRQGDYKMIQVLYGIGMLQFYDVFDLTCTGRHDGDLILEIVARYPIPNYKEMIDTIILNGLKVHCGYIQSFMVDCGYIQSFMETALIYKNFPTAAYLKLKGGTFRKEEIDKYNEISDIDIYTALEEEYNKLVKN
jgi:hypothetical protein